MADQSGAVQRDPIAAPPYVSFNTFMTLLDWLGQEGVPLRFDRSFWHAKFSGTTGTQLTAALRFLGLLDGDRPLPGLEKLVQATAPERRVILRALLQGAYGHVPLEALERATPAMVRGWLRAYPVGGHTLRKAISFFVNAARDAEIPMSSPVRRMAKATGRTSSSDPRERASLTDQGILVRGTPELTQDAQLSRARTRKDSPLSQTTIPLESGGSVSLGLAVDLFQLSDRDRRFVLELVALARDYQERGSAAAESAENGEAS